MAHILRFGDGRECSPRRWDAEADAVRAAVEKVKRTGLPVEVWWLNDAGTPKVMVRRIEANA